MRKLKDFMLPYYVIGNIRTLYFCLMKCTLQIFIDELIWNGMY